MILTKILKPGCVKVPVRSKDKKSVISELMDLLDANKLLIDKSVALDAVLTREKTKSTGIGLGIAVPHGKCKAVKELVIALGIAAETIEFDSIDGKPVAIIILLVSPTDQTGPHIQALATISKLMLDDEFKQSLENAESAEQAYQLIASKEAE